MRHRIHASLFSLILVLCTAASGFGQIYVDASNTSGPWDGVLWSSAYQDLQNALADAVANPGATTPQIWVAESTYWPGPAGAPRTSTFAIPQQLQGWELLGGFKTGDSSPDQRSGSPVNTILSGDLDRSSGNENLHAYHVLTVDTQTQPGSPAPFTIDGFTIADGNAGVFPNDPASGGGIFTGRSVLIVMNTIFENNWAEHGGGLHTSFNGSTYDERVSVLGCTFTGNGGNDCKRGGGVNFQGSGLLVNCLLKNNRAGVDDSTNTLDGGGGLYSGARGGTAINCLFYDNVARGKGGAVYISTPSTGATGLINCTISLNRAKVVGVGSASGPGIWVDAFNPLSFVHNCIVRNNINQALIPPAVVRNIDGGGTIYSGISGQKIEVRFSNVGTTGVYFGNENINEDSLFVSPVLRDFRLLSGSPCVDAGKEAFLASDSMDMDDDGDKAEPTPWDLISLDRVYDILSVPNGPAGALDMGAYELQVWPL